MKLNHSLRVCVVLLVAVVLQSCHSRTEEEVGAAPDRGDTTAVAADTSSAEIGDRIPADSATVNDSTGYRP